MNNYNDATRGTFQNETAAKQLVSFDGLRFEGRTGRMNVTPTDVDMFIELENLNAFIFAELKYSGDVPEGQALALEHLVNAICGEHTFSIVFVAIHNTDAQSTIIAKDAVIKKFYWRGKWYIDGRKKTLKEGVEGFIKYIKDKKEKMKAARMAKVAENSFTGKGNEE